MNGKKPLSVERARAVMLLAATAALAITFSATAAAPPVENGKIAFSAELSSSLLFSIKPSGGKPHRLTIGPENASQPVLSPDRKRIAFVRGPRGKQDIYVMNRDGTGVTVLTSTARIDYDPCGRLTARSSRSRRGASARTRP
jgi:hypothetical protein